MLRQQEQKHQDQDQQQSQHQDQDQDHQQYHHLKSIQFIKKCKFDLPARKDLEALQQFFTADAAPHLESVTFHTPTLSNERVGQSLFFSNMLFLSSHHDHQHLNQHQSA